jgi:RNA polymerase sigma factor (TIGR02999 family)
MDQTQKAESELASLLERCSEGDRKLFGEIFAQLYRDIHAIARRELRREQSVTIRPTALVHEVYLRMESLQQIRWQDRAHLLAMASRIARQALIDAARRRRAEKRDGGLAVTLSDENLGGLAGGHDALDVEDLLNELESYDDIAAQVVSLRVFGGLSGDEVAEYLGISLATVNRRWAVGKAWLTRELSRS